MSPPTTVAHWHAAWETITALTTARFHDIPLDQADVLDGCDHDAVIAALVDLVSRILGTFPRDVAAEILRDWGASRYTGPT